MCGSVPPGAAQCRPVPPSAAQSSASMSAQSRMDRPDLHSRFPCQACHPSVLFCRFPFPLGLDLGRGLCWLCTLDSATDPATDPDPAPPPPSLSLPLSLSFPAIHLWAGTRILVKKDNTCKAYSALIRDSNFHNLSLWWHSLILLLLLLLTNAHSDCDCSPTSLAAVVGTAELTTLANCRTAERGKSGPEATPPSPVVQFSHS